MNQLPENQQHPMPDFSALRHVAITPLVSREKFAELVGIEPGVVLGWCNKGYIPTVPIPDFSWGIKENGRKCYNFKTLPKKPTPTAAIQNGNSKTDLFATLASPN